MSDKVQTLRPELAAQLAAGAPAGQVISALEGIASSLISEQLRHMFESADDVLFEMADKARRSDEKQTFLNTMRTVRVERPRILKAFQDALHQALRRSDESATPAEVDVDDLEKWTLQESSDLEEKIAVSNMDAKAGSMYAKELGELEQRLSRLSDDTQGAVSPKALCPARILDAFRLSMKGVDVDLPIKLVIYKLFDRVVVSNLGGVFSSANQMLEAQGIKPKNAVRPPKKDNAPLWKPQVAMPAPAFQHMASGLRHAHLAAAMQAYGADAATGPGVGGGYGGGSGYGAAGYGGGMAPATAATMQQNAQMADEMLAVLQAAGHGRPTNSWMPTQNLALVSRMFDDFYADPQLPEVARPVLGRLQFPVMKLAMSDPNFFADPNHPVRALVHDVYDNLTAAQAKPGADFRRLEELIQDLLQRFDPDPAQLKQRARAVQPVTEQQAERFLEQQRERLEQQKKALLEKIRRIVAQELRLHIGSRRLPKPLLPLILSGIGPILVAHYRAGGEDSPGWRSTLALLDRVMGCLDAARAGQPGREAEESAVILEVAACLTRSSLPPARVEELADPLVALFEELGAAATAAGNPAVPVAPALAAPPATGRSADAAPAAAPATPDAAPATAPDYERRVQVVLRGGDWFKVWCSDANNCRWLKLEQYYQGADTVVFEDFGGENRMKMRATAFLHDLVAGRSTPVDPDPSIMRLLKQLPPPGPDRIDQAMTWFKTPRQAVAAG